MSAIIRIVEALNKLIEQGNWQGILDYLVKLDPNTRRRLFNYLQDEGINVSDFLYRVSYNVVLQQGKYTRVLGLLKQIDEEAAEKLARDLDDIAVYRVGAMITERRYSDLAREIPELEKLVGALTGAGRESAERALVTAKVFIDPDLRKLLELVREKRWRDAYQIFDQLPREKVEVLSKYLEMHGIKREDFFHAIALNYLVGELARAKTLEEVVDEVRRVRKWVPEDIMGRIAEGELLVELREAAERKDWAKAMKIIDAAPTVLRPKLGFIFLYLVSGKLTVEDLDDLKAFAAKYGIRDVAAIVEVLERIDTRRVVDRALETLVDRLAREIQEVLARGDPQAIDELKKRYGSLLEGVKVKDRRLLDVLDALKLYLSYRRDIERLERIIGKVESEIARYLREKPRRPETRLRIDIREIDAALAVLNKLEQGREKLALLEGVAVKGLRDLLEGLERIKALLLMAKALLYYDEGRGEAIKYASEAARLNPDYAELAVVISASLRPDAPVVECILRREGLLPRGAPVRRVLRRVGVVAT